jgi:DNA primase small subunit
MFGEYYVRSLKEKTIHTPKNIKNKEFAFIFWNMSGMHRHVQLLNISDLLKYLERDSFRHVYISGARYRYPHGQNMSQKEWLDMDFLIDIDADHFQTPCKIKHDSWICQACGEKGKGTPPEKCSCGSISFEEVNWICDECLDASKKEIFKLTDIFLPDFDINQENITIHFSGHRGYHLLIDSEEISKFDQLERREFVDYLTAQGLNMRSSGIFVDKKFVVGPSSDSFGWGKHIHNAIVELIKHSDKGSLDGINISKNTINNIIENKDKILTELKLSKPKIKKDTLSISKTIWLKLIDFVIHDLSVKLDIPVSIDLHRLIRFQDSLHGKTGFKVQEIKLDELKEYDPFKDAVAFSEDAEILLETNECPSFRIGEKNYGPFEEQEKVKLPVPAAIFLLCKDIARLNE